MKMARIVITFYVLLAAAITVGGAADKPASPAAIRAATCCDPCPPICPPGGPGH